MIIHFDVDDTLISWDVHLRPGVHEILEKLQAEGHAVYLWSGYGPRWEVVRKFELEQLVLDCFWKPLYDHHARLGELGVPHVPDYVIDDHAEVVEAFGGSVIRPAYRPLDSDREMWRVYEEIAAFAAEAGR